MPVLAKGNFWKFLGFLSKGIFAVFGFTDSVTQEVVMFSHLYNRLIIGMNNVNFMAFVCIKKTNIATEQNEEN